MSSFKEWFEEDINVRNLSLSLTETPKAAQILPTFENLCPVIYSQTKNLLNDEKLFWKEASNCVLRLTSIETNPEQNFETFMETIYKNINFFSPKTPEDCLPFLENYASPPLSNFIFVTLADILSNPSLLIKTMSYLKYKRHKLNIQFQQEKGAIEKLFDFFLSYLSFPLASYPQDFWDVRLMLCDLLVTYLCKNIETIVLAESQISYLHAKLLKLITDANPYTALPFIRLMIYFHKQTLSRTKPEIAAKRLNKLFTTIPAEAPGHPMVARFVTKEAEKYIQRKKLIPVLFSQGFYGTWDIQFINTISAFNDPESTLLCAQVLAKTMCLNWCYSRLAGYCLSRLLERSRYTDIVSDWFIEFLTQLQIANALQEKHGRYKARRKRIDEILHSDLFMRLDFVNKFFETNDNDSEEFKQMISEYIVFGPYLKFAPFTQKAFNLFGKGTGKKKGRKGKKGGKGKKGKRAGSVPPKLPHQNVDNEKAASDDENQATVNPMKKKNVSKRKPPMKV